MASLLPSIVILSLLATSSLATDTPIIGILTIPCVSEPWYCPDNATDNNATSFMYAFLLAFELLLKCVNATILGTPRM